MKNLLDCLFCQIVSGKIEASLVYQDTECSAFMDIQPVNPGHLLIVPNKHAAYLMDLEPEVGAQMFRIDVFPRFSGDGFGLKFSRTYYQKPDRRELDQNAEQIKSVL